MNCKLLNWQKGAQKLSLSIVFAQGLVASTPLQPGIASILIQACPHHMMNGWCEQPCDKSMSESQPWDRCYLNFLIYCQNKHFQKETLAFWSSNGLPLIKSEVRACEFLLKNDTIFQTKRLRLTQGMWSTYLWSKHNYYFLPYLMPQNLALDICSNSPAFFWSCE